LKKRGNFKLIHRELSLSKRHSEPAKLIQNALIEKRRGRNFLTFLDPKEKDKFLEYEISNEVAGKNMLYF
jgi:hypothetical protein